MVLVVVVVVSGADYSNEAFAATGSGGEEEERVPSSSEAGALSNTVSVSMGDVHDVSQTLGIFSIIF
jgi:hypothetical protein